MIPNHLRIKTPCSETMLQDAIRPGVTVQPVLCGDDLKLRQYSVLLDRTANIALKIAPELIAQLDASAQAVASAVASKQVVYGVTTGFGGMANISVAPNDVEALQANLLSFLATGAGAPIDPRHTRGAMLLRANVLLKGKSGVRRLLVERLVKYLNSNAIPLVREHGSIGASGDLVPLSTIARAVTGHSRHVHVELDGEIVDGQTALHRLKLDPITLQAKEGLALINGTSFSAAIAANAVLETRHLMAMSLVVQSMLMSALLVDRQPFESFVHESKPHPGQVWTADILRGLLSPPSGASSGNGTGNVQDRYSLRCFPQYCGPIVETVARIQRVVEIEMNSVSDNPLVDPSTGDFYQSGNFLGQYIGVAMDDMRRCFGLLAKHLDVQIASLVAPEFNHGLSASLRGNVEGPCNMGLKGLQLCGNSIMPLLTHQANPLVEHFPTHAEQFNQNVNGLSWGAAHLAWRSVELFRQYLAIASLFAVQAIDLRAKQQLGHYDGRRLLGPVNCDFYQTVCRLVGHHPAEDRPFLFDDSDRWLEQDLEKLAPATTYRGSLAGVVQPIVDSFDQRFGDEA